jgi:hypothetical protein
MPIEGSLDIMWMNPKTSAAPRYNLFFLPYANPRNGSQKPYELVGDEALKEYLVKLEFKTADAEYWVETVRSQGRRSIPNVWMPEWRLSEFERPKAAGA